MKSEKRIEGTLVDLKVLKPEEVGREYLAWLHDREVNRYLEIRHALPVSEVALREFVANMYLQPNQFLFGMFTKLGRHIGNIKLGDVSSAYQRGDIGLFIGDRQSWGQGIAAEAIGLVTEFGFDELRLAKIQAGVYSCNQACIKAFQKNSYQLEGVLRQQYRLDSGEWTDGILLGKLNMRSMG